ncbi:uncharacterized protein METZ01_LOCUS394408 [marine metagenome]|uniref:DNA methyltransferase n=1 Tax=marine metagenome TaxID=408172 RepID=A0A382V4Z8_9ZZZZ
MNLPNKKYNIIYADPPWSYGFNWGNGAANNDYKTMSLDEIKQLPIQNISSENCQLYLWTTNPFLVSGEAIEVVKSWGFTPKQLLTWAKTYHNGELEMGMGYYYRNSTEHIIYAIKGKVKLLNKNTKNLHIVINPKKHSKKPDYFRDMIVRCSGDLPRIELFAREKAEGWDSWGLEV